MDSIEMRRLRFLRKSQRRFDLLERAEKDNERISELLEWLNKAEGTAECDRIVGLIEDIRELRKRLGPVSIRDWVRAEMSGLGNSNARKIWRRINRRVSDYKGYRRCTIIRTRFKSETAGEPRKTIQDRGCLLNWEWWPEGGFKTAKAFETKAAHQIMSLEESGLFDFLRRCRTCHRWFLATRKWNKFCNDRCRDAHYSHSSEVRAKRAGYMRTYRKNSKRMSEESRNVR